MSVAPRMLQEGKIGLRWRTQAEVVSGKGQFACGAKGCDERRGLDSFEVNLGYQEAGVRKNALVKLRVCPAHGLQLNYKKNAEVLKVRCRFTCSGFWAGGLQGSGPGC